MALIRSKQFWVAVLALIQTLVLNYLHVPAEIWASIDAILVVVIGTFTVEQVAMINAESRKDIARMYSEAAGKTVIELRKLSK